MAILDDLIDVRNRLLVADKLVYAVSAEVTPGKAIIVKETEMGYEFILFHSEDDARHIAEKAGLTPLHVRDAPRKPIRWPGLDVPELDVAAEYRRRFM